jgi:hypothetical protein
VCAKKDITRLNGDVKFAMKTVLLALMNTINA